MLTDSQSLRVFAGFGGTTIFELTEYLTNGHEMKVHIELDDYKMETVAVLTHAGRTPLVEMMCALQRLMEQALQEAGLTGERYAG